MARVGFPWELIKHCFGGITARRESSTIQAFIEEGRRKGLQEGLEEGEAREARRIILRQGRIRFGDAGDAVRSRLEAISDLEQLELLGDRLLIVSSWDQLLGQEEP
jgi:predicted transposase YdaD